MAKTILTDELHRYAIGSKLRALRLKKKLGLRFPQEPGRRDPAFHFESLTFPLAEPKCQAYLATFHPLGDGKARPHEHAGVEVVYVLSGELGVTVEATEHMLEMGDAIYFAASVPHSYRRAGPTTCSALVFSVA